MQAQELVNRFDVALKSREAGDYSGALAEFERLEALSVHPQDIAGLRLFQAMCLTDMGKAEQARDKIASVDKTRLGSTYRIDYESECARIERVEGRIQEALDRVVSTLGTIEASIDKHRMVAAASGLKILQGVLLAELGRCDEAVPILTKVSLQDEWGAEAKLHLGDCNYKKKQYEEAIDCYLGIISGDKKVHPVHRDAALRNIGYAYYDLENYDKAIQYLTKVKDSYDSHPELKRELLNILAAAYARLGNSLEAKKYL